jgi:metal-responsive CopG/Arc/MetJ family transcriptional regulator
MGNIKTAVSIQENLFKEAEALARDMKLSRSGLFAHALEEFIRRQQNRQLLKRVNDAYSHEPGSAERNYLRKMRRKHRKLVEGEW